MGEEANKAAAIGRHNIRDRDKRPNRGANFNYYCCEPLQKYMRKTRRKRKSMKNFRLLNAEKVTLYSKNLNLRYLSIIFSITFDIRSNC